MCILYKNGEFDHETSVSVCFGVGEECYDFCRNEKEKRQKCGEKTALKMLNHIKMVENLMDYGSATKNEP